MGSVKVHSSAAANSTWLAFMPFYTQRLQNTVTFPRTLYSPHYSN